MKPEVIPIQNTEGPDVRERLVRAFGDLTAEPDAPRVSSWTIKESDGDERSGELVLDLRNRRLKLYDLQPGDARGAEVNFWRAGLQRCPDLYTKLIVYARPGNEMSWIVAGFLREGVIAGFFADGQDAHLWAAFGDESRAEAPRDAAHDETVRLAATKPIVEPQLPAGFTCLQAEVPHAGALADLMASTFSDYPTPITAEVIAEQIASGSHIFRFLMNGEGEIVASASAEIDHDRGAAEMTDCATRPDQRGGGHMAYLLHRLAQDVQEELGVTDLYTLARADEVGMNCVFGKLGYVYTGRLVNNCRMPNGWESMNVWCRSMAGS